MATIHPSRAGIVPPPPTHALPPRPTAAAEPAASREEELRRKLLARRSRPSADALPPKTGDDGHKNTAGGFGRLDGAGEEWKGRELLGEESGAGLGILGRARREQERDEGARGPSGSRSVDGEGGMDKVDLRDAGSSHLMRDDGTSRGTSTQRHSPGGHRRRYDRTMDGARGANERDLRRSTSPEPMRADREPPSNGQPSRSFIHPDRLRLQDPRSALPPHSEHSPRRDARGQGGGYADWLARRNGDRPSPRDRDRDRRPRERHDLPPRPSPLDSSPAPGSGVNGSGKPVPTMPPFPPNRRLTAADFEQRRVLRDTMEFSIWPPSPPQPWRDPGEVEEERRARRKERKKSKRSKRKSRYSDSDTPSSDSEYERKRRRRKERERERQRRVAESSSEEERTKRHRTKSRERSTTMSRRTVSDKESDVEMGEEMWVEKGAKEESRGDEGSGDEEVGPRLPSDMTTRDRFRAHYTGMLYGEAEAMEAYAADGKRIPRRGEVGLDAEKIEQFEASGYVMSGNRHKRMNAVRLRKENQVINAEEKRAILKLQREEKVRKEGAIVSQFREMLEEKLREGQEER